MKKILLLWLPMASIISCKEVPAVSSIDPINWEKRSVTLSQSDSLTHGSSYLSVYSEIYSQTEHITHDLTVTISMRNTSSKDSIFINRAQYFNTQGNLIRTYFDQTIYIAPLEAVEIVIDEKDQEGGTGANFIFDWSVPAGNHAPLFEGVMISTSGQQGLSFTTQGVQIK